MRRILYATAVFSLLLAGLAPAAKTDTIFSNLVTGGSLDSNGGFGIGLGLPLHGAALAAEFVPSSTFFFTSATLGLSSNVGTTTADVFLMTSVSGAPGTVLESFVVNDLSTTTNMFFTVNSILDPELLGGTPYWLAVTAADASSNVSWRRDTSTDINTATNLAGADTSISGPWGLIAAGATARPGFEIDGTPVPEPNTLILLAMGLVCVGFTARRRLLSPK